MLPMVILHRKQHERPILLDNVLEGYRERIIPSKSQALGDIFLLLCGGNVQGHRRRNCLPSLFPLEHWTTSSQHLRDLTLNTFSVPSPSVSALASMSSTRSSINNQHPIMCVEAAKRGGGSPTRTHWQGGIALHASYSSFLQFYAIWMIVLLIELTISYCIFDFSSFYLYILCQSN